MTIQSVHPNSVARRTTAHESGLHSAKLLHSGLIREASTTLRDASTPAEERIRRADAILEKWMAHLRLGNAQSAESAHTGSRGGLAGWQVRRLESYVQENLANPIRIADMALLAKLSPHHFCRTFRASLNETPHTYVVRMRVQRASALLRTTSLSLCRIAAECGFADQAHFNKLFRKFLGQSPGAWRRMQANANDAVEAAVYGDWRIGETALPGTESRQRQRGSSKTGTSCRTRRRQPSSLTACRTSSTACGSECISFAVQNAPQHPGTAPLEKINNCAKFPSGFIGHRGVSLDREDHFFLEQETAF